jgi:nucleoside-diphosphate-sugar epimerase
MDVDVLLTGVTGFVGRFILLDLIENHPHTKIGVVIRTVKGKTPVQRFHDEIICDTMFSKYHQILSKVTVIGASIEDIEKTSLLIEKATCIIHCAANVKHYDPYSMLMKDNVQNIQIILNLAEKLKCQKLILLSTCYVHPKADREGATKRIPYAPREAFYNDYCYTKWLGEEEVFKAKTTIKEINIVRLSCVGAPLRKDLLSHPFPAQAHLGILSLTIRGYIRAIGLTSEARLSIIPVDLVSRYIISIYDKKISEGAEPILHQACPPKHLDVFHPNLVNLFSIAEYELGIKTVDTYIHDEVSENYLPMWYNLVRFFYKKADRLVDLHNKVQEFILLFTGNDIRFDSSVPPEYFPRVSEKDFLLDTVNFSVRVAQQLQFKKGVTLSLTDKFWHNTGAREAVLFCGRFTKPFELSQLGQIKNNLWALFTSNRKFTTVIENNRSIYRPGLFESYFSTLEFDDKDSVSEALILSKGLNKYTINNIWHTDFVVHDNKITHMLFYYDHGLADGVGLIKPIINKMDYYLLDKPVQKFKMPSSSGKSLNPFKEIIYTLMFMCIVIGALLLNETYACNRVLTPSISTTVNPIIKSGTMTYTTNLLWKLTKSLAARTKRENFIFCIPSVISVNRAADEIMHNNFVSMLLPVSSTMTEEQFRQRCNLLKSRGALLLMYCVQELISMREWWWLRDKIMSKVTAVVSSVNLGENMPSAFSGFHILTTTPNPIPFCITAFSGTKNSSIVVRSHDSEIHSSKILQDIS